MCSSSRYEIFSHSSHSSRPSHHTMKWLPLVLLVYIIVTVTHVSSSPPEPPFITKQPGHIQLFQVPIGEPPKPFTLECEAFGNPEPRYYWFKNGHRFDPVAYDKRISQTSKRGSLTFTEPDAVDEGLYQCFVENIHGTAVSNAVFLRKSDLASFPRTEPKLIKVTEGEPLSVECNPPTGYPKPSIYWYYISKSGALTSFNSSRLTVDPDGRLHFSNVTLADELLDEKAYVCSAASVHRTEYKIGSKFMLDVTSGSGGSGTSSVMPKLQYGSPPSMTALRGQSLELYCIYGGTPLPDVQWRKNNNPISGNRYEFTNFGKTLRIPRVDFQDESDYMCTASNGVGQAQSRSIRVEVLASPYWKKSPTNLPSAEGERVQFECEAGGKPEPKLQWLMNGKPLDEAPSNPRRKLTGNMLTIENLVKTDTAVFQCNASNAHGYAFKNFYLNVLALPPSILERPAEKVMAVATGSVTLRCRVFGAPKAEVRWYRDGVELTGGDYTVSEEGDLTIKDIKYDYAGEYECRASNKLGEDHAKGTLQVKQKTEITKPPVNFEVAASKLAKLTCMAQADPSLDLQIIWSFGGKEIDFDQNQRMVKSPDEALIIQQARELDSGEYTCTAKTSLDQVNASATLTVQDVPNPPSIVGVDCGRTTTMIEWKPNGDNRANIRYYIIQFNTSFTPTVWEDATFQVPSSDNRHSVSISPWANYTFRVVAVNKIGPSKPSEPSKVCLTEPDVPHENPTDVRGWGTRPDNMVISWKRMPQIQHNAPGFYYKVFYKRDNPMDRFESREIYDWKQDSFVVNNTPTYKPYKIRVEAHNSVGQAHTTAREVTGWSGEAPPSQSPQNFRLNKVEDYKTADLSWDPVSNDTINGLFMGYRLFVWNDQDGREKARDFQTGPGTTRAKVDIFKPNARNRAVVVAFNKGYEGPESNLLTVTTPEGPPGPVSEFDAVPIGSGAFYLVWRPPEEKNGELLGYKVTYQEVRGNELVGDSVVRDPITNLIDLKYKLAGLKSATKYRIEMQAFTKGGDGVKDYIERSTLSSSSVLSPDAPDFSYRIDEQNGAPAVRITWVPNLRSGRPGSYFYVQYRRQGETTYQSTPPELEKEFTYIHALDPTINYEVRAVSVDGENQASSIIRTISLTEEAPLIFGGYDNRLSDVDWLIGMLCAIALVIVLTVVVCAIKRNRGAIYWVHEKRVKKGRDFDHGDDGPFLEYSRASGHNFGSRTSLTSSIPDGDSDVMTDNGQDQSAKFVEDGSFIGIYGAKEKKRKTADVKPPTGQATFV